MKYMGWSWRDLMEAPAFVVDQAMQWIIEQGDGESEDDGDNGG